MATTQEVSLVKKYESVKAFFAKDEVRAQLQGIVPSHVNAEKLLRVAFSVIKDNPGLLQCSMRSLVGTIIAGLQLGLSFEKALGQAYPVPFKGEVQLIIGYRGLINLARNSGEVAYVSAHAVYANDVFEMLYGTEEKLTHVPADNDPGAFRGAYCVFHYKDGTKSFDYMGKAKVDKIRARSKAGASGPWVTDYEEMAVKTVIRHHAKLVPLSTELAKAMAMDERTAMGEIQTDLLPEVDMIEDVTPGAAGQGISPATTGAPTSTTPTLIDLDFEKLFNEYCELEQLNPDDVSHALNSFVSMVAKSNNAEIQAVKAEATKKFPEFWAGFKAYSSQGKAAKTAKKEKTQETKPAEPSPAPPMILPVTQDPGPDEPPPPPEPPKTLFGNKGAAGAGKDKW